MHKCLEKDVEILAKNTGKSTCEYCGKQICAECAYEFDNDKLETVVICPDCALRETRKDINQYKEEKKSCKKYMILFIIGILLIYLPVICYLCGEIFLNTLVKFLFFGLAYSALVLIYKAKKYDAMAPDDWVTTIIAAVLSPIYLIIGVFSLAKDIRACNRMMSSAYSVYSDIKKKFKQEEK